MSNGDQYDPFIATLRTIFGIAAMIFSLVAFFAYLDFAANRPIPAFDQQFVETLVLQIDSLQKYNKTLEDMVKRDLFAPPKSGTHQIDPFSPPNGKTSTSLYIVQ